MDKVSFDFDDTLSIPSVQRFANQLVDSGYEVWIVTSRQSDDYIMEKHNASSTTWNNDLHFVAKSIGIKNIHFCNLAPKYIFFAENEDFLFHLDDDVDDVSLINDHTIVNAIHYVQTFRLESINKCKELL